MSNNTAPMAPMPEHDNTGDPLWRSLWHAYEPVITALRRIPLTTDVEICGGEFAIHAQLTDGSHLWITSIESLPVDPAALEGYHVRRAHHDNPTIDEPVYDSTEGGDQAEHGNNVVPLIQAITAFVTARKFAPPIVDLFRVQMQGITAKHTPVSAEVQGPFTDHRAAVKEYGYATHELMENGWERIHEQGGTDWPLTIWKQDHAIVTVFVGNAGQAIG
ncbi:hypothetical protein GR925_01610 [Streptomyces sp. HUCO-GS316]|uniref:hypothetical protein n=1 Tax=Streptomyces sp. HUCO-GS316 TaxID=2692198 RepID=UPI0013694B43|nr:hypothetical protein [Streptomyces sp. HUCO-GS316]MXM62180.1 hypothetical protein [Streptomyces sp. HUCO-GS316]